ncbi:peptide chain release factor N(5)-glutamine methyltransferase [Mycoplasma sp. 744]|uniref:peptide chain release factor N(5)-glutamine methyltransferase n=1 Tax=Mycoplasma sp. 744 TaxID=3108531 RepID=UPI002B1DBC4D|nr:peptide chain release factor N(5)-glutamine methyltransferase [Mycoplasma sp. 744]MEA4115644.1 peptide chain release factor N(5)-glutamine methyltransferase [Mycoplasma sp. 744]
MNREKQLLLEKRKYNSPLYLTTKEKKLLKHNVPIQQIMGFIDFNNLRIQINNNVLIPRYETDELVHILKNRYNFNYSNANILDLCCGSGFIGLHLKKIWPLASLTLSDISYSALKISKLNRKNNFFSKNKLSIKHSNLFQKIKKQYDLIVANPPYLDKNDLDVSANVKNFEPHIALFGKEKGWQIYRIILEQYRKYLKPNGILVMEINPKHLEKWNRIANIEILNDINNKERFIILQRN